MTCAQISFVGAGKAFGTFWGCVFLLGYGLTVCFLGENIGGILVKVWHIWLCVLGGAAFIGLLLIILRKWQVLTVSGRTNLMIFVWSVLIGMGSLDVLFSLYENLTHKQEIEDVFGKNRHQDPQVWYGELSPRIFQPTNLNFNIHKPNVQIQGHTYGEFYNTLMRRSPTLRDAVLELRPVTFYIDEEGFRDQTPIQQAEIFVLGDSFVFGYGTAQEKTWVELLERSTEIPLYNLGVSSTGPGVQYQLLKYVLEKSGSNKNLKTLFWMIYEGNDLENNYEVGVVAPVLSKMKNVQQLLKGTILEQIFEFPEVVKKQSVVDHIKSGRIRLKGMNSAHEKFEGYDPYIIDGVTIEFPLFFSKKLGPRLFNPTEIKRVTKSLSYVMNHPNRIRLDETFQQMKELSQQNGFKVVVILAPSAARAYGSYFEHFPALSERPFFLDYVEKTAKENGFRVLNLLPLLAPYTEKELLYYRDDHHWNERGNFIVANLIQQALFP